MKRPLTIALDYDDTFTADPELWCAFIRTAHLRGHVVVCITGRLAPPAFPEPPLPNGIQVICCGRLAGTTPKREMAEKMGVHVDIWIDDIPAMIDRRSAFLDFPEMDIEANQDG